VNLRIYTEPAGARFSVDGTVYTSAANFLWPTGSKHIVKFVTDSLPSSAFVSPDPSAPTLLGAQLAPNADQLWGLNSWTENTSNLVPTADTTQIITADPSITSLKMTVTLYYRILLNLYDAPPATIPATCDAGSTPPPTVRGGLVYLNSQCYWNNAIVYIQANSKVLLNAFPYPGFAFLGWSGNLGTNAYLTNFTLTAPITLVPLFTPAKRVRFETDPLGLQVLVDRTVTKTLTNEDPTVPCPRNESISANFPATFLPLCLGDFDFAPYSQHVVAANTPQLDGNGKLWAFDSWGSGQGQNAVYTADNITNVADRVIVKFVPGAQASFVTTPPGLKLTVDGRSNWSAYNFVWGLGTTHQVSAAPQQTDATGRQFTLKGWSNGGSSAQTVTIDQNAVDSGLRMVATYTGLSRLTVQATPPGQSIQVDGVACQTPCIVDRPNGASVQITAAPSIPVSPTVRMDFSSWSDGGAADHAYVMSADTQTVTANYTSMYQLASNSDPANGALYQMDPSSSDGFFPNNTQVNVSVSARPGFKFRRWSGDLVGTYPAGSLMMTSPHAVTALMDRVPYIAPTGVQNAAGVTPNTFVAAGSLVAVVGESLAPDTVQGKANPLSQTLDGVTVTIGDRLLPLVSVAPQQIVAQLPSDLAVGDYQVTVHSSGQADVTSGFSIARNAPGIYANLSTDGTAYVVAFHADGTNVSTASPAAQGEQISILGTGFGPYVSPVIDGFYPFGPAPALADPVDVLAADQVLQPDWVGAATGQTGMVSLKLTIPNTLPTATNVDLQVRINGVLSNTVQLPLQ
jgi:uncharacterized protein (TIGR03437 family)